MNGATEIRRKDRAVSDPDRILEILKKSRVAHVGMLEGEYPYVVPLHYGFEYDGKDRLVFYMHGAPVGHKLDVIRSNPNVCVEAECEVEDVSGGDVPCRYGSAYASVIARGKAEILTDPQEKIEALKQLMLNQTGRAFEFTEQMAAGVAVIKVTADSFTAKSRRKA